MSLISIAFTYLKVYKMTIGVKICDILDLTDFTQVKQSHIKGKW